MGRRKKEPESVHREAMAAAAERLFMQGGIEAARMDDIARESGYSKATLYVYFSSKEEIITYLVAKSMHLLHQYIVEAVSDSSGIRDRYFMLCRSLAGYQQQFPLYFGLALGKINVDVEDSQALPAERAIYETGELINRTLIRFVEEGIRVGDLRPDIPILQTVFLFWGSLSGLVQLASSKEAYFQKSMGCSREEFLEYGFERLYRLITKEDTK